MKVVFFERLTASEENVSSTRIRSLVLSGALSQAHALLGRPYSFLAPCTPSKVVHRACSLSAFYVDDSLLCLPPEGDYEATVCLGESRSSYEAILHIYRNELSSRVCEVVVNAEAVPAVDFLEVIPRRFL
jgi:FAD synthase